MQFLQFAATAIVTYLGLPTGFFLASLTREELHTARKYFTRLVPLVFIAAAVFSASYLSIAIAAKIAIYVVAIAVALKANLALLYFILGLAMGVISNNSSAVLSVSSLVFLFGLLAGSLYFKKKFSSSELLNLAARNALFIAGCGVGFAALAAVK